MKVKFSTIVFIFFLMSSFFMDISNDPLKMVDFVTNAEAIIGAPFTPLSCAGVARRTTRRMAVSTSAATTTAAASTATQAPPPQPAAPPPAAAPVSAVPIGTVVKELPKDCQSLVINNVSYSECAGAFYKTAFLSNNLVYVVVENPL